MMVFTCAVYMWLTSEAETAILASAFILDLFLSVPFYLAIRVCGPRFAFAGFPFHQLGNFTPHAIPIAAAPNGIPSVHMATALLVFWFLRRWWWGWLIGFAFTLLTILATLGLGEHYLFDLICAIPYAATRIFSRRFSAKLS
jgi:hypothetical protein